ncbi:Adenine phosphoribosyltransferase [Diplonema papillatum]|nr:Adenine phosphoribosyltransferase [Diplonema papillatum]|eukprot:gene22119-33933_t
MLTRGSFRTHFATSSSDCVVLYVVHCRDARQAVEDSRKAVGCGIHGLLLINQVDGGLTLPLSAFLAVIQEVRAALGDGVHIGANVLGVTLREATPLLSGVARLLNSYWADDAGVDETGEVPAPARPEGWPPLYFGGVAFKKQRPVPQEMLPAATRLARRSVDVITTSGPGTGVPAELSKVARMRRAAPGVPLAVASGVTADNVAGFLPFVDCVIVATGVSESFHEVSVSRLSELCSVCRGAPWYLSIMPPRTRQPAAKFAWLDPTAIYGDADAWRAVIKDMAGQLVGEDLNAVCGVDATGFILGAAVAHELGLSFVPIRKADKLCVVCGQQAYVDYSNSTKLLELARPVAGRVAVIDQWMETGGTMDAAVTLMRRSGADVVAALVIVAESKAEQRLNKSIRVLTVCRSSWLQKQFDRQHLECWNGLEY